MIIQKSTVRKSTRQYFIRAKVIFIQIHAAQDFLIPISQARLLFDAATSRNKRMLIIQNAEHNNIFFTGEKDYIEA